MSPSNSSSPTAPSSAAAPARGGGPAEQRRGGPTDPSHDEELRRGILHTEVRRAVATGLTMLFLIFIATIPISQAWLERSRGDESVLPDLFDRWPTQESIKQFEEDLDKSSYAREAVRPWLQQLLSRYGRFGNTKAVIGRQGWLFYQPGVAAVGGPGLLDADILASRAKGALDAGGEAIHPDPRPAILDFQRFLAERGIKLILFPVPDKAGLHPTELHGRSGAERYLMPGRNPDHLRLSAELRAAGVLVFDPTPERLDPKRPPRFMRQDTHWTPTWMDEVAIALADFVRGNVTLEGSGAGGSPPKQWRTVSKSVARVGDIVDMLRLPPGQTLFLPETIEVEEVQQPDGTPFEPAATAEILLLGDSFANVFTLAQMGWGEGAGLGPHLARALGRDIDIIAQNDSGAFATRQLLWNELNAANAGEPDRLTGKRVVIWEFASRELAVGNWKPLPWPRRRTDALAPPAAPAVAAPGVKGPTP